MSYHDTTLTVRGRAIRLLRGGTGQPLLFLHDTLSAPWSAAHDQLAQHGEVLVPIHPGCLGSTDLEDMDSMEDLVFHYLALWAALRLDTRPLLIGASLGGWLAAEWAVRYPDMLRGVVLVDALGLRVPEAPAADLLRLEPAQMRATLFAAPATPLAQQLVPDVPDPEAMEGFLRARQTFARFAWQFPDNPKLSRYLYRVHTPTLVIWGDQDGVVSTAHGHAYAAGITSAELVVLQQCGHLPHIEQPEAFVNTVVQYLARLAH